MDRFIPTPRTLALAGSMTLIAQLALAAPMGTQQVRAMAQGWLSSQTGFAGSRVASLSPLSWEASAEPVFYLATLDRGGWLLLSGDDALLPVVGWSSTGLPTGELPPALVSRLQSEEHETLRLRSVGATCSEASARWQELVQRRGQESQGALLTDPGDVDPMIEATWGQGSLYNTDCPADAAGPGGHTFVGCVGVAVAQVLDYWNWPQQGQYVQSYFHNVYGEISVDFNQESYDWSQITPNQTNDQVKRLLYHTGVAVRMNYGPNSSSAQSSMIASAMASYFRYQNTARMVWRSSYTQESWQELIRGELLAGRPVIYRGQGPNGGHAYNVDGVQDSTWFHINWGWQGSYNGWFELEDLSPGNYWFGDVQGAVIGIVPQGYHVNHQPLAPALNVEIDENQTATVTLGGYDADGDALTYQVGGQPIQGNSWSWTPPANTHGTFVFSYQACDGEACSQPADLVVVVRSVNQLPVVASMTLESLEDEPVEIELAGFDADQDDLRFLVNGQAIEGDVFRWTPPANAHGEYSFTYTACDAEGCGSSALLVVNVLPVNDPPQAQSMLVHLLHAGTQNVQLQGWDVDADSLVFYVDGVAIDGNVFVFDFQPTGLLSFHYSVADAHGRTEEFPLLLTFDPKEGRKTIVEQQATIQTHPTLIEEVALPERSALAAAYPNPFNPTTTLPVELAESGPTRLSIYNVAGQRVAVLLDGTLEAGRHEVSWTAGSVASGAYLAVLETPQGVSTQILQLIK